MKFFDDGCSDCIMWEDVPGVQWEGVVTKNGPFDMEGLGGLAALTRDEWMVLVPLANGNKQAVRCQSMTRVTATFHNMTPPGQLLKSRTTSLTTPSSRHAKFQLR